MKAHVIENGVVVNTIVVDSLNVFPNLVDGEHGGKIGDLWDGHNFSSPLPAKPTQAECEKAVQTHLDDKAKIYGYDSILSASSYAAADNPFQAECAKLLKWRGDTWVSFYEIFALVDAGKKEINSIEELISLLPEYP